MAQNTKDSTILFMNGIRKEFTMKEVIYVQELSFSDKERAFEVAKLLLEENYIVMVSKEEELVVISFQYSYNSDRNDVIFLSKEEQ